MVVRLLIKEWKNDEWKYSVTIDNKGVIKSTSIVHLKEIIAFHTAEQETNFYLSQRMYN